MIKRTPLEPWLSQRVFGGRPFAPDALFAWQLGQLQDTIEYARARSPFYAKHLAGVSLPQAYADIAGLPFLGEADIRREGYRMLCLSQGEIERVVTLNTSGTAGPSKRLWFTRAEQEEIVDFFHYGISTLASAGDRVMILLPCERPGSVGDLLAAALPRLGALPLRHGPLQSLPACLRALEEGRANVLVGAPAQVRALAVYARDAGRAIRLKSVLLSTDYASCAAIETIAAQFDCVVFDHYGMTEMGLGGGVECAAHAGYHLREADLFFEVVDPVSGLPLPEGEYGEVVFSTLRRRGMPLIRYRTGDISRFLPGPCPCGSHLRRLDNIRRRLGQGAAIGQDTLELCVLDEALFRLPDLLDFTACVDHAQASPCLRVETAVLHGACGPAVVEAALLGVDRIARAVESGALTLDVRMRSVSDWPSLHAGKRTLASLREGGA
ncbi:MAG: phenylacetate--CoA ligase family protein [Candidatus Pelethousia sp.]|nr:phenylacetate--CoA ligase family protein [Candidatus Pelethousia sp.]